MTPDQESLTDSDINRAVVRIAHEILERNRGADNLVLLGIPRRGLPLAKRIAAAMSGIEGREVPADVDEFPLRVIERRRGARVMRGDRRLDHRHLGRQRIAPAHAIDLARIGRPHDPQQQRIARRHLRR